jgi:DNA-binding IscR family transcriptional regulator
MAGTYSLFDILSASGERLDITACKSLACSKKKDQCELALLLKPIETQIMFSLRHSIISVRA